MKELTSLEIALSIVVIMLLIALIVSIRRRNYSRLMVVENKDRKFGAKPFYLALRINANEAVNAMEWDYAVNDEDLSYFTNRPILFFTVNEMKVAINRAKMNPEDIKEEQL